MSDDTPVPSEHSASAEQTAGREDRIIAVLTHLRRGLSRDGRPPGESSFASQEACLAEWAESMGLLLNPEDLPTKAVKGGQEHDLWHDQTTQQEIDDWFESHGFQKVAEASYFRAGDNLGVFDAHDKNVIRAGDTLMPFDVIPCLPEGGFFNFIRDTLTAGHSLRAVRTTGSHSIP